MRLMSFTLFLSFLIVSTELFAAPTKKIKEAVESYYSQQAIWSVLLLENRSNLPRPLPPDETNLPPAPPKDAYDCQPHPQGCVEAVCNQLSKFDCDDRSELLDIVKQCRNVRGECVRSICSKVSRFDCDDKSEIYGVTEMCRGLFDIGCIDYVCSRLSKFDCDDISELREIAHQCR